MKRLLIVLMLAAACGFAQTSAKAKAASAKTPPKPEAAKSETAKWPIESVTIEGARHYTRDQILAATGLKIGQVAGKPEFEAARDRLVATGIFDTVSYKFLPGPGGKGYAATFQVVEIDQSYPVRFYDLHVSEREAEKAIQAKYPLFSMEHLPATQPVLEKCARLIQEFIASKGIEEKVAGAVVVDRPGEFFVEFHPSRPLPAVAHVHFKGNEVLSEQVLWDAVSSSAVGFPYTEDSFREMLMSALRPLYEARGRVRLNFPEMTTAPATDVQGLTVTVTVDEGQSYTLGKVGIEGQSPVDPTSLLKTGDFKTGDVANMDLVNQGVDRIRKAVKRAGYLDSTVAMTRKIDEGKKAVNLTLAVDPGPLYTMGKLNLVGLELEGEAQIKRMWGLKLGSPFNVEYPDLFLARVRDQGVFDRLGKTRAETKPNAHDHSVDVTLYFGADAGAPKSRRGGGADFNLRGASARPNKQHTDR